MKRTKITIKYHSMNWCEEKYTAYENGVFRAHIMTPREGYMGRKERMMIDYSLPMDQQQKLRRRIWRAFRRYMARQNTG